MDSKDGVITISEEEVTYLWTSTFQAEIPASLDMTRAAEAVMLKLGPEGMQWSLQQRNS